ncbi:hypothetical protein RRG08_055909 [Elysia crispata]|uniref:Uncharacterized protein n=1 Tax=Elysia crispata TaxID=231223 RepID=A0AAE0Y438_9GAST|nr:hypothetical protein RRG08_055909 [Elysia crispata]
MSAFLIGRFAPLAMLIFPPFQADWWVIDIDRNPKGLALPLNRNTGKGEGICINHWLDTTKDEPRCSGMSPYGFICLALKPKLNVTQRRASAKLRRRTQKR